MKIKFTPAVIYPALILLLFAIFGISIWFKNSPNTPPLSATPSNAVVPQDETHKGIGASPSKNNVSETFIHQLTALKNHVEKDPGDTLKVREYADLLAESHKVDEALPLYESILKKYPKRIDLLFSMSTYVFVKKDYAAATAYTKRILLVDKKNGQAMYNLGAIAATSGNKDEAKRIWEDVVKKFPGTEIGQMAKNAIMQL